MIPSIALVGFIAFIEKLGLERASCNFTLRAKYLPQFLPKFTFTINGAHTTPSASAQVLRCSAAGNEEKERTTWAIITGEYPPQPGGVSDYSWIVAHALHAAGDDVHVFVPGKGATELESPIPVHRLSDRFGRRGRRELFEQLSALPKPRRALLQFVLQSFGMRAVNLPFALLLRRLRGFPLWIMYHEFSIADDPSAPLLRRIHAFATRVVARIAAKSADVSFMSTPSWKPLILRGAPAARTYWLPIPSNVSTSSLPADVERLKAEFRGSDGGLIVGHFGTYRMHETAGLLEQTLTQLCLSDSSRHLLLLGRGSDRFAAALIAKHPSFQGRVFGIGELESQDLANHLAACDLLLQPYPDGATTRRGSLFAGLALGVPTVTTIGSRTEDFWKSSGAAFFAPANDVAALLDVAESALNNESLRTSTGRQAHQLYSELFDISHTIEKLRGFDEN